MEGRAGRERHPYILCMLRARGQECVNMGRQEEIAERMRASWYSDWHI